MSAPSGSHPCFGSCGHPHLPVLWEKKKGGVKRGQPSSGCNPALWQDIPGRVLPRHSSVPDHGCFSFHQEPPDPTELGTAWRFCSFRHEAGVFAFDELINPYVAYLFKLVCRLTRREGFIFNEYLNGSRSSAGCHGNCSPALPDRATVPSWVLRGGDHHPGCPHSTTPSTKTCSRMAMPNREQD